MKKSERPTGISGQNDCLDFNTEGIDTDGCPECPECNRSGCYDNGNYISSPRFV